MEQTQDSQSNRICSHKGMLWFVGAGPGDPDLITVKGHKLVKEADVLVYAGSLIPSALIACAQPDAVLVDASALSLEETHSLICDAVHANKLVVRLHAGDASLFSAVREQKALLDAEGIPNAIVPGIGAAFAAAAAAGVGFTVLDTAQSLAVSRVAGRRPVPPGQRVREYAQHGGSMAIYLSGAEVEAVAEELFAGGVHGDTPIVVASRVGWPDEQILWTSLKTLVACVEQAGPMRQVVFLVLPGERKI